MSVYYEVGIMLFDLLWKALAPALGDSLPAGHYASICGTFIGGPHPETGKPHRRSRDKILENLKKGYISAERARKVYGT
ncbi:MAG: hypothetical protein OXE42_02550 [Gammaproteobacteria bacterium]|nr:hypothetical protein [Gammaproteobacteria bacterium]